MSVLFWCFIENVILTYPYWWKRIEKVTGEWVHCCFPQLQSPMCKYRGAVFAYRLSSLLISLLRQQKLLFPSLFHSASVWSHGTARLYLTHASIFFINIHIPTNCSDDEACMLILPGQLTASGPLSDQRCGHDRCLRKERRWSELFIVT